MAPFNRFGIGGAASDFIFANKFMVLSRAMQDELPANRFTVLLMR
jgi:hypothetical protein